MRQEIKLIKRELRQFKKEIENFEKRSKIIKVVHKFEFNNRYSTQINVTKKNKVVNEMIEYIKGFCDYVEVEQDGSIWLRNYDDLTEEDANYSKPEYEVCIYFIK